MRAYLYSQRSIINGVSYICYDGELLPEKDVLDAFNRFFGIYQRYLERGYNIDKIGNNDIGNKIILLPQDRTTSDSIIVQMKDFVKGSVSDAVANLDIQTGNIRQGDSLRIVDQRIYSDQRNTNTCIS